MNFSALSFLMKSRTFVSSFSIYFMVLLGSTMFLCMLSTVASMKSMKSSQSSNNEQYPTAVFLDWSAWAANRGCSFNSAYDGVSLKSYLAYLDYAISLSHSGVFSRHEELSQVKKNNNKYAEVASDVLSNYSQECHLSTAPLFVELDFILAVVQGLKKNNRRVVYEHVKGSNYYNWAAISSSCGCSVIVNVEFQRNYHCTLGNVTHVEHEDCLNDTSYSTTCGPNGNCIFFALNQLPAILEPKKEDCSTKTLLIPYTSVVMYAINNLPKHSGERNQVFNTPNFYEYDKQGSKTTIISRSNMDSNEWNKAALAENTRSINSSGVGANVKRPSNPSSRKQKDILDNYQSSAKVEQKELRLITELLSSEFKKFSISSKSTRPNKSTPKVENLPLSKLPSAQMFKVTIIEDHNDLKYEDLLKVEAFKSSASFQLVPIKESDVPVLDFYVQDPYVLDAEELHNISSGDNSPIHSSHFGMHNNQATLRSLFTGMRFQ